MMETPDNSRQRLLVELLDWTRPTREIVAELAAFPWDSETKLVIVGRHHLQGALERYLNGSAAPDEIEEWAEALESRDDIGFEEGLEKLGSELLSTLANPELEGPLSGEFVRAWLSRIG